jgi:hypothetical protein
VRKGVERLAIHICGIRCYVVSLLNYTILTEKTIAYNDNFRTA